MKTHRCRVVPALVAAVCGVVASARGQTALPGASEFASNLLQYHAVLLAAPDRVVLDEINRQLREADDQLQKAGDPATREQAARKQAAATGRLVALLEGCAAVHRVALQGDKIAPPLTGPYELPGDEGGLLFRLESGTGETRFSSQELDQARREHTGRIEITCPRQGVTWLLVGLYHLPVKRTILPVEIKRDGSDPIRTLLNVVAPDTGRVKITALDDDDGRPTPVMVRITSRATGRDRPPSNAIDLAPQFDGNGRVSGQRRARLFGRLGGEWWCVPGPFEMALPPGSYDIALRRGAEHLPVFDQFTVTEGGRVDKTYRPRRWVDMRHLGWYSGDDHVHGRIVSDDDAGRLMAWIKAEDVHVANIVKMGDVYRTYFEQRGWGKDYRVTERDYVLSPGQECPRTPQIGHTLSMNTSGMVRDTDRYYLYDWVIDAVHAQGGLFGYAHVNSNNFHVDRDMSINVPKGKVDFGEILQFFRMGPELWYDFLNAGFKVTASAGSDVPWGGSVGEVRMYAFLGNEPFSADAWFEAVRRGRTFVTNGPMIEFHVDDALPGDEIRVDDRTRMLRVRARAWSHPERNLPKKLTIVRHGEVLREAVPAGPGSRELSLDFTVTADDGFWIAARVDTDDNSSAHTTPVYVTRPGLRFWKYGQVEELLNKRLGSLSEIEAVVAEALEMEKAGKLVGDHALQQLALQGPELLKRVAEARRYYEELRQVATKEKALRTAK